MTDDNLSERLRKEFNFSEDEIIITLKKVTSFSTELFALFEKWFDIGAIPEKKFFGVGFNDILSIKDNNPVKAFIFFDWILRDPERTANANKLFTLGYPVYMLENSLIKIENLQPKLKPLYNEWLRNNKEPEISIRNYSYHDLISRFKMKPIGAFFTLDWLIREPEKAMAALERGIM